MEVTIKVPDKLAVDARARGVSVEAYVQEILARQALGTTSEQRLQSVSSAIQRIFELCKGNKLTGLRTKDLINEDHKY
jgi:plasmid stability protein